MEWVGDFMIPGVFAIVILFGFIKKIPVFSAFTDGVKQGISATVSVAPSLIALVSAVTMLKVSGTLDIICQLVSPITDFLGIPGDIISLGLMRPISGSGSTAILNNILNEYGPDSTAGKIASVMAGSTETTFYAIAVYYGAINIKNTRHTVPAALCADLTGMVLSCVLIKMSGS